MKSNNILVRNWLSKTAILVFSIFLVHSCKKDEQTIGLGVLPGTDALQVAQDSIFTNASLYRADSIRTDELAQAFIGNYLDPQFGQTNTTFFCQLELPGNDLDLGEPADLMVDSIVLTLRSTQTVLGSLNPQEFSVYRLTGDINEDSLYYSDDTAEFAMDDLIMPGENLIKISDASVISRGDFVYNEIRFPLNNSLGQLLIDQSGESVFEDDESFQDFFKGLAVVSNTANAGVIGIDPNSGLSAVNLYYRDLTDPAEPDTTQVTFQIDNNSAYFNHISRDYSSSVFGDFVNGEEVTDKVYLQGIQGVYSKLDFVDFPTEIIGNDDKVVALAQLILPVNLMESVNFDIPSKLYLNSGTHADSLKIIADEIAGLPISGFYDEDQNAYIFNCTLHIQSILSGETDLDPFWISVNPPGSVREFLDAVSIFTSELIDIRRVVLNSSTYNPQSPSENMRLELTYSE